MNSAKTKFSACLIKKPEQGYINLRRVSASQAKNSQFSKHYRKYTFLCGKISSNMMTPSPPIFSTRTTSLKPSKRNLLRLNLCSAFKGVRRNTGEHSSYNMPISIHSLISSTINTSKNSSSYLNYNGFIENAEELSKTRTIISENNNMSNRRIYIKNKNIAKLNSTKINLNYLKKAAQRTTSRQIIFDPPDPINKNSEQYIPYKLRCPLSNPLSYRNNNKIITENRKYQPLQNKDTDLHTTKELIYNFIGILNKHKRAKTALDNFTYEKIKIPDLIESKNEHHEEILKVEPSKPQQFFKNLINGRRIIILNKNSQNHNTSQ